MYSGSPAAPAALALLSGLWTTRHFSNVYIFVNVSKMPAASGSRVFCRGSEPPKAPQPGFISCYRGHLHLPRHTGFLSFPDRPNPTITRNVFKNDRHHHGSQPAERPTQKKYIILVDGRLVPNQRPRPHPRNTPLDILPKAPRAHMNLFQIFHFQNRGSKCSHCLDGTGRKFFLRGFVIFFVFGCPP